MIERRVQYRREERERAISIMAIGLPRYIFCNLHSLMYGLMQFYLSCESHTIKSNKGIEHERLAHVQRCLKSGETTCSTEPYSVSHRDRWGSTLDWLSFFWRTAMTNNFTFQRSILRCHNLPCKLKSP